jgi:hypothetical protein
MTKCRQKRNAKAAALEWNFTLTASVAKIAYNYRADQDQPRASRAQKIAPIFLPPLIRALPSSASARTTISQSRRHSR